VASGFFALLDDISTLMDDIAATTKIATQKTVGLLGDDLAINAKNASGFVSSREIPILIAITKGSFINKLILLPIVFLLSAFIPQAITPLLVLGGAYLAFEGVEKIYEYIFGERSEDSKNNKRNEKYDEKSKIKSAIRTDFILSIEIVIMALGSVKNSPIYIQLPVVALVSFIATIGVYGIVAVIVRMDDFGIKLIEIGSNKNNRYLKKAGVLLIRSMPVVIKILSYLGTIAMILVAGSIYLHNIRFIHDTFSSLPVIISELITGMAVGILIFAPINILKTTRKN